MCDVEPLFHKYGFLNQSARGCPQNTQALNEMAAPSAILIVYCVCLEFTANIIVDSPISEYGVVSPKYHIYMREGLENREVYDTFFSVLLRVFHEATFTYELG